MMKRLKPILKTLKTLPIVLSLLPLAACETGRFNNPYQEIELESYSRADDNKLADEMENAPPDAVYPKFIRGYKNLRGQVRAIQERDK